MSKGLELEGTSDLVKVKNKKVAGCFLFDCSFVCVWRLRGFYSELPDEWSQGPFPRHVFSIGMLSASLLSGARTCLEERVSEAARFLEPWNLMA